jgi:hypothetical protein
LNGWHYKTKTQFLPILLISCINAIFVGSQSSITFRKYTLCVKGGIIREKRLNSGKKYPPSVTTPTTELSVTDSDWIPDLSEFEGYNQYISHVFQNSYPFLQKNESISTTKGMTAFKRIVQSIYVLCFSKLHSS